ncbi:unnamed protein product [Periconia digitata]|uniref:Uncharacterized protein n=1 Tax=Periconia digitata TaxID=1303443 RepID=A0A9W4U3F8_9PLEO|nr:unnamed protein product [Periconia digitata]
MERPGTPRRSLQSNPEQRWIAQQSPPFGAMNTSSIDAMRVNPKLLLARRNSPAPSIRPSTSPSLAPSHMTQSGHPDISYSIRGFDDDAGHLYAVCRAVPYLLGPKSMLDALSTMRSAQMPDHLFINDEGTPIPDTQRFSFMDRALVLVLYLLQTPLEDHTIPIRQLLSHFDHHKDALIIYKDMGTGRPVEYMNLRVSDFANLAIEWHAIGNPGNVSPTRPDAITPWQNIIPHLAARHISSTYLTKSQYEQWIMVPEPDLPTQLNTFVRSGGYERLIQNYLARDVSRRLTSRFGCHGNTTHGLLPSPTDRLERGAKRFSHEHPCGRLIDFRQERHDNALLPEDRASLDKEKRDIARDDAEADAAQQPTDPAGAAGAKKEEEAGAVKGFARLTRNIRWVKVMKYGVITLVTVGGIGGAACGVYFYISGKRRDGGMNNVVDTAS